MNQKNKTASLVLALIITNSLIGLVFWWFTSNYASRTGTLTNQTDRSNGKTFTQVTNVPNGLFSYGGSTTWATIRRDLDPAIQTVWPQFKLRYTQANQGMPSTGSGIRMLLDNQLTRRLFVIVKKNDLVDQQAGEAYANLLLTEQGQEMIQKAGFVRIR